MTGGGTIGAATAVDMQGNKASEKVISYMREEMASTAEARGRDVTIARGMVDDSLGFTHLVMDGDSLEITDIEGRKVGRLITLTTNLALKYGIADGEAENIDALLNELGLSGSVIKSHRENWSENIVRFLTNPIVASLGIAIILWGLYELLLPEIPVGPEAMSDAFTGLTIGIIGGLIGLVLLLRLMTKTKFWVKLTAPGVESKSEGYSSSIGLEDLTGYIGTAETDLRPSGWILVQEQRIFVITEGTFINKGDPVKILSVDGNRVLVRKIKNKEE